MSRWRPIATTVLSVFGIGVATYLTLTHYDSGAVPLVCASHGVINCEKVTTSPQSVIFGVPVAVFGLVFFVAMLFVSLPGSWRSPSLLMARARLAMVIVAMGFVIYLVSMEVLVIHAICLWCTSIHITTFLLFVLVVTGWTDTGWAWAEPAEIEAGSPAAKPPGNQASPGRQRTGAQRSQAPGRKPVAAKTVNRPKASSPRNT
ncbi:MAG: vitamin K epoxide reductase family protein [Actinobacteria bacterium]|nr:vitamin K epoxide reductase family protein [Actinomycetota bacterium]